MRKAAILQDFGNTLVALGILKHWFVWAHEVDDIDIGCTCGYCRHSRIIFSVSYTNMDGEYFEYNIDI